MNDLIDKLMEATHEWGDPELVTLLEAAMTEITQARKANRRVVDAKIDELQAALDATPGQVSQLIREHAVRHFVGKKCNLLRTYTTGTFSCFLDNLANNIGADLVAVIRQE